MLLKYFIDKATNKSIAINVNNVICITEDVWGTKIKFVDGTFCMVTESILESVAKLNAS